MHWIDRGLGDLHRDSKLNLSESLACRNALNNKD